MKLFADFHEIFVFAIFSRKYLLFAKRCVKQDQICAALNNLLFLKILNYFCEHFSWKQEESFDFREDIFEIYEISQKMESVIFVFILG